MVLEFEVKELENEEGRKKPGGGKSSEKCQPSNRPIYPFQMRRYKCLSAVVRSVSVTLAHGTLRPDLWVPR